MPSWVTTFTRRLLQRLWGLRRPLRRAALATSVVLAVACTTKPTISNVVILNDGESRLVTVTVDCNGADVSSCEVVGFDGVSDACPSPPRTEVSSSKSPQRVVITWKCRRTQ